MTAEYARATRWSNLLPAGVVVFETDRLDLSTELYFEEQGLVSGASPSRVAEFAAGRFCARHALARLGFSRFPLLKGLDGAPVWPPNVVGSITHSGGYCAAAAGFRSQFGGIGIDAEVIGDISEDMLGVVCTPAENPQPSSRPPFSPRAGDDPVQRQGSSVQGGSGRGGRTASLTFRISNLSWTPKTAGFSPFRAPPRAMPSAGVHPLRTLSGQRRICFHRRDGGAIRIGLWRIGLKVDAGVTSA